MTDRATYIMPPKSVRSELDYLFDWSDWLAEGETITSETFIVEDGITLVTYTTSDTVINVWLSGGTAGEAYTITCVITTSHGHVDERTALIPVMQR